tara:strand:+ start:29938 stop:30714 length:777 start_codon:yes stop_codon:yes gene_type:complete
MLNFKHINTIAFGLLLLLLTMSIFTSISIIVFIILFLVWLTITTIGSFNISCNYHLQALNSINGHQKKQVAITFDDGPHHQFTPQIIALLKSYNANATFFCIGKNIENHPELIKNMISEGHTIGNHTYNHSPYFDFYSRKKVAVEINRTNQLVESIIGKKMNLFRPPYGVTNPAIKKAIKQTGHHVIGWNIRSLDTVKKNSQSILNRITKNIAPGSIILLHDSKEITVDVLEQLLLYLQKNDYQTVTINTLFNIKAYA